MSQSWHMTMLLAFYALYSFHGLATPTWQSRDFLEPASLKA